MARLPNLTFHLRKWKDDEFKAFRHGTEALQKLAGKAGLGSDAFDKACQRLMKLAVQGRAGEIPGTVQSSVDVRALSFLFGNEQFRERVHITTAMMDSLYKPKPRLGLLTLFQLLSVFFRYFDLIAGGQECDRNVFAHFCALLQTELARRNSGDSGQESELAVFTKNRDWLFSLNGPQRIVDHAQRSNMELEAAFKQFSLQNYHDARFHLLCKYRYYLDTLRNLPPCAADPVLSEVCKPEVYNVLADEKLLLGHKILEILIDRAPAQEISDAWRNVILTIAGDPRISENSQRFVKWWFVLGKERQNKVKSWLAGFDVRLFLDALQECGVTNRDLKQMFPDRKIFLDGLIKQNLVQNARFFVSNNDNITLRRNYLKGELPEYARVTDVPISMIYLQVGHCHLIEGTHNFKLWIFPKLPTNETITNYTKTEFTRKDLSSLLQKLYNDEFGDDAKFLSVIHDKHLKWLDKAIKFIRSEGIQLEVEQLMERDSYRSFKRKYRM